VGSCSALINIYGIYVSEMCWRRSNPTERRYHSTRILVGQIKLILPVPGTCQTNLV
jgi:hypothetical protein